MLDHPAQILHRLYSAEQTLSKDARLELAALERPAP
jgi:hypothetical protein